MVKRKPLSEEHKEKIRVALRGRIVSEETKEKLRQAANKNRPPSHQKIEMEKILEDTWPEPWQCDLLKMEKRCLR